MLLQRLHIENFRGFSEATVDFERDLTVLVGVNGAGKSSILDAVAIGLSRQLVSLYPVNVTGRELRVEDVRQGRPGATVALTVNYDGEVLTSSAVAPALTSATTHFVVTTRFTPWPFAAPARMPLAIHLRSPRAFVQPAEPSAFESVVAANDAWPVDGLAGALLPFEAFVTWFRLREDIENEQRREGHPDHEDVSLRAVRRALTLMLPQFENLRARRRPTSHLVVQKGDATLSLDQLSEGEKGLIAMVGDIARRMALAAPTERDPLALEAVILIDEIELHLHPAWQREVPHALRRTFSNAQFVLTTHSPQVIGELPSRCVRVVRDGRVEAAPAPTEGRDSNRILEVLMGAPSRSAEVSTLFVRLARAEDEERWNDAWALIDELRSRLGEDDPDVSSHAASLPARDAPAAE